MKELSTTYENILSVVSERAKEVFPNKILFSKSEASKILGISRMTMYRRTKDFDIPRSAKLTVADIANIELALRKGN